MGRALKIIAVGCGGALKGLLVLAVAGSIMAFAPAGLTNLANRTNAGVNRFVPRSSVSPSQSSTITVDGTPAQRKAVRRALDSLAWSVRSSTLKIVVTPPEKMPPSAAGTYIISENAIRVSSIVVDDPERQQLAHILAHETGHMLDMLYLSDPERAEFMRLRGRDPAESWEGIENPWAKRPQEDFAEVYAALSTPTSRVPIQTDGGPIRRRSRLQALVERCAKTTGHAAALPRMTVSPQLAYKVVNDRVSEPGARPIIAGLAVMAAAVGALIALEQAERAARKRRRREAAGF